SNPSSRTLRRNPLLSPYPLSASRISPGIPARRARSSMPSASSALVRNVTSAGIRAWLRRSRSLAQLSGRYNSKSIGACCVALATSKLTPTWQFVILPAVPVYCRCTPTECLPCLRKPVSSTTHVVTGSFSAMAWQTCRAASSRTASSLQRGAGAPSAPAGRRSAPLRDCALREPHCTGVYRDDDAVAIEQQVPRVVDAARDARHFTRAADVDSMV